MEYTQTRNPRFSQEAPLIISKITHNSPTWLDILPSSERIAKALQILLDAILQAPLRIHTTILDNQAKKLQMELKEKEALSKLADKELDRQITAEKAELAKQKELLEIDRQMLEVEQQRFEYKTHRLDYALKTSRIIVDTLRPEADEEIKGLISQSLITNFFQLEEGDGLKQILPAPELIKEDVAVTEEKALEDS
jgi:hypothetical protein